ncbi:MAG: leucyl/phenylalanyl-tRNA--protein transferase [Gammaproteobacteria bacterium]
MSTLPWLSDTLLDFPPVSQALKDPDGLLAVGGDLRSARLINAYQHGIFPWYQDDQPILWWSPALRMALAPEQLRVSRSMRKILRKQPYRVTLDTAFQEVIEHCADVREDDGTWITPEMQEAYCQLHEQGVAHSVEVWEDDQLVGGLYGIAMGQLFFGESMFSLRDNASKIGFIRLVEQLQAWQYQLIDCQVPSEHLRSLGAEDMPRDVFLEHLQRCKSLPGREGPWQLETDHFAN